MQLTEIKRQLGFNKDLQLVFENQRNVAAARYHQIERNKKEFYIHLKAIKEFFPYIDAIAEKNPIIEANSDITNFVLVTSDSGFMKGLNNKIIEEYGILKQSQKMGKPIVIGEKGASAMESYANTKEFEFYKGFNENEELEERATEVTNYLMEEVFAKRIGKIKALYPHAHSLARHTIELREFLPVTFEIPPLNEEAKKKLIVESEDTDLVKYAVKNWVYSNLVDIFKESKIAEYAARTVHFDGAAKEMEKIVKATKDSYDSLRKELIDKGNRETISAKMVADKRKKDKLKSGKKQKERQT
jgi:ATP synthase F1 gamma subunit